MSCFVNFSCLNLSRMSLIMNMMNHAMPWFSLVHHHLPIYDHTGPDMEVISAMVAHRDAWWRCMTYIVRFNNEYQGSHGTLCFYLIDIIYIIILKCRIPSRTLIFMPTTARAYLSLILSLFLIFKFFVGGTPNRGLNYFIYRLGCSNVLAPVSGVVIN